MVTGDEAAVFADGAYAKDARKKALRSRGINSVASLIALALSPHNGEAKEAE
jgi:hypothetical protein